MPIFFTDDEIKKMISEKKSMPENYESKLILRSKRGHKERDIEIFGINNLYKLIFRQSQFNPFDFSIILSYCPKNSNLMFRLRRNNGKSHEHTNFIEKNKFYDFHVHYATERYQLLGSWEDAYAEPTDKFYDFQSALRYMFEETNIELPKPDQLSLF